MSTFNWNTTGGDVVREFGDKVKGKTIAITGASEKGLGGETAIALAHGHPERLILLARSKARVESVITRIHETEPSIKVDFVPVSLDDFDSVREAAATINSTISKLDILINNAGIMAVKDYTTNKAGIESQLATNHLGHFLLTKLLFAKIEAAGPGARIVNLTSLGHTISPFRFDDYNFSGGKEYDPWSGYGQSKSANVLFSLSLANKLGSRDIQSYAVHPGAILETQLANHMDAFDAEVAIIKEVAQKNTGRPFDFDADKPKSMAQGIATTLVAALDPRIEAQSGSYMADCQPRKTYEYVEDPAKAEQLWKLSEELVGEKFDI